MKGRATAAVALVAVSLGALVAQVADPGFPHREHEGLFPACTGCHAGIETGDPAETWPEPEVCVRCHDGEEVDPVTWAPPGPVPTFVRYAHVEHARAAGGAGEAAPGCAACHRPPGETGRMAVEPATADACLGCHAHEAPDHLAPGRECGTCHLPVAATPGLSGARVAAFPRPPDHDAEGFVLDHGEDAVASRCATCHAQESCARCHLDVDDLPVARSLAPDPRVAAVVADLAPVYPEPPDHDTRTWAWEHGPVALEDASACATCHVREGCRVCHGSGDLPVLGALPERPPGDPRGVVPVVGELHAPGYAGRHGPDAGADPESCATCHETRDFCVSCHDAPGTPAFHLPGFIERHGPEAYAAATDCTSCHDPDVFCRGCHQGVGLGGDGRVGVGFHTTRPFWLVGHGVAARQGLEGCAACHTQSDCARCHAATTGWRVDPHGPGFDPARERAANPWSCIRCHPGGGAP